MSGGAVPLPEPVAVEAIHEEPCREAGDRSVMYAGGCDCPRRPLIAAPDVERALTDAYAAGEKAGRESERGAVVAWLRHRSPLTLAAEAKTLAWSIETGEHR